MHAGSRPSDTRSLHRVHLKTFLRSGTEFRNVEGTTGDAVTTADAVLFLKIDNSVGVLHDRAVRRAGNQAARLFAVHALIFAHQQHHGAVFALVLVELDQVPVIPCRFRHGLVTIGKVSLAEGVAIPFEAGHFTRFATDAGGGVDEFADLKFAVHARARQPIRRGPRF